MVITQKPMISFDSSSQVHKTQKDTVSPTQLKAALWASLNQAMQHMAKEIKDRQKEIKKNIQ